MGIFDRAQTKFVCVRVCVFVCFISMCIIFLFFLFILILFFFFLYCWNAMPSPNDLPLNTVAADRSRRTRKIMKKKEILIYTVIIIFEFFMLMFMV